MSTPQPVPNSIGVITIAGQKVRGGRTRYFADISWALYVGILAQKAWGVNNDNIKILIPKDSHHDIKKEVVIQINAETYKFDTTGLNIENINMTEGSCWNSSDMIATLSEITSKFKCETLFIFMFGHGQDNHFGGGLNFKVNEFSKALNVACCKKIIVIADTCHSEELTRIIKENVIGKEVFGVHACRHNQTAFFEEGIGDSHELVAGSIFSTTYT